MEIWYWIALASAAAVFFIAGFIISRFAGRSTPQHIRFFNILDKIILDNYVSVQTLLNVEKIVHKYSEVFTSISPVNDIALLRYNGISFSNMLTQETIELNELTELTNTHGYTLSEIDDYIECGPDSVVFKISSGAKREANRCARIYFINYDFLGVTFLMIVYLNSNVIDKNTASYLIHFKRQLYLLLYLYEISEKNKKSQEFLDGVFNNNPIAISISGKNGDVTRANREFYRIFSKNFKNIKNILDDVSLRELTENKTLTKDIIYNQKNLKIRSTPLYEKDGSVKGYLFSITDDSLQYTLYKRLESSEERYRRLLKELPLGLVIINQQGIIYFVNDNFMYSLGFSTPDKLQGKSIEEFFEIPYNGFINIAREIEKKEYLYFKFQTKHKYGTRVFSVNLRKIFVGSDDLIEGAFQDVTLENALYAQLEDKNRTIEEDLSTARAVWENILSVPPIYSAVLRFETFYKASYQLGGDFYDVIQLDDIHVAIIIADASGHGVSASLMASTLKILVEFAPKDPHKIPDMIKYINTGLNKILPDDQYITMFYGVIDTQNNTMEYINCGHPLPLIFNDKTGEILTLKGMSFSLRSNFSCAYDNDLQKVSIPPSCKILLYTDGLTTFKKENRIINTNDLIDIYRSSTHLQTKDILNDIYVKLIKNSTPISEDDICMLLVLYNKSLAYKKFLSIPSNVLEIDFAIVRLKEGISNVIKLGDEDSWKLYTALYEALINAVEHGNKFNIQRRVKVFYRIIKDWIVIKVRDEGTGFDVNGIPNPLDDANILKPSGRGVYMIRKLMNRVKYNKTGNETIIYFKATGK